MAVGWVVGVAVGATDGVAVGGAPVGEVVGLAVGEAFGAAVGEGGGSSAVCGDGDGRLMVPVSTKGVNTLLTLPLTVNTNVSVIGTKPLPGSNWKPIVSPGLLAYTVIWKRALPA